MSEQTYQNLARRLDAIPNGFPSTASGVELQLLAKIFTPEEAALASEMRLTFEPVASLAERTGLDPEHTRRTLKEMARKGLLRVRKGEGKLTFALLPFVVGIYEEQLPRLDAELAALFEAFYLETQGGGITKDPPAIHRVIPVETAIPFELEIFPYEKASTLLKEAKSWGVRDCICRVQQQLLGKGCERPVQSCLVFAPVEGAFHHSEVNRAITLDQALVILRQAAEAGLVHSTGNFQEHHSYICNCCTCCCGILRGVSEFSIPTAVARADFLSTVDAEICSGCGDCLSRCQFEALSIPDGTCEVDTSRCVGCGLCASACPEGALQLHRRPIGEVPPPPETIKAWMVDRAIERNISLADIL